MSVLLVGGCSSDPAGYRHPPSDGGGGGAPGGSGGGGPACGEPLGRVRVGFATVGSGTACLATATGQLEQLCAPDGWCWIDPYPQGNRIDGVDGAGPDDAWFVGEAGTVLRREGDRFVLESAPPAAGDLEDVVVLGPDDVWAAGGAVLHRDAAGWREVEVGIEGSAWRLHPSPAGRPWLSATVSNRRRALRPAGAGFELVEFDQRFDVLWAAAPDDVWLADAYGVWRWDGSAIRRVGELVGGAGWISGTAPDDVWVAGRRDVVHHWDGAAFATMEIGTVGRIRAVSREEAWAFGSGRVLRWDGSVWNDLGQPFPPTALWPDGTGSAWIAGAAGELARREGDGWTRFDRRSIEPTAMTLGADGAIWAAGREGAVARIDPDTLGTVTLPSLGTAAIDGLAVTGAEEVWALAAGVLHRWDGCRWKTASYESGYAWNSISASGGTLFVGGRLASGGAVYRHDENGWDALALCAEVSLVEAVSPASCWVATAGDSAELLRWSGAEVERLSSVDGRLTALVEDEGGALALGWTTHRLRLGPEGLRYLPGPGGQAWSSVWGSGPDDVWVVEANDGAIAHLGGARIEGVHVRGSLEVDRLTDVRGTGVDDVWFAGKKARRWRDGELDVAPGCELPAQGPVVVWPFASGEAWMAGRGLCHFDGTAWSEPLHTDLDLRALWASGPADVWAAGPAGLVHFDGTSWTPVDTGHPGALGALGGTGPGDVWAAGRNGLLLHRDGTGWSRVAAGTHDIVALHGAGDTVLAASDDGTLLRFEDGVLRTEDLVDLAIADVWAAGPDDVWLVGGDPAGGAVQEGIRHWNGRAWARFAVTLDWPESRGLVRWAGQPWLGTGNGRTAVLARADDPGVTLQAPAASVAPSAVDGRGRLWALGASRNVDGPTGFVLRRDPPP